MLMPHALPVDWSVVPFYVVGEATAKSLADVQEAIRDYFSPKDIRGASESGTSERLAHFILKDLASMAGSKKLLYLTGDKNRDTLPKILNDGGFTLEAVQVYATQGSATFASDLDRAIRSAPPGDAGCNFLVIWAQIISTIRVAYMVDHIFCAL